MNWDPVLLFGTSFAYLVFWLHSATIKLSDPLRFSGLINAYHVLPERYSKIVTWSLGVLELAVGLGLLVNQTRFFAAWMGILILIVYAYAIGINLKRGRLFLNCGCYGLNRPQPIRPYMLWRHLILAAGLFALGNAQHSRAALPADIAFAVPTAIVSALIYLAIDQILILTFSTVTNKGQT